MNKEEVDNVGEAGPAGICACERFAISSKALGSISLVGRGGESNRLAFVRLSNPILQMTLIR